MTHYVVVRDDLTTGQMAAQIIHAAGESGIPPPQDDTIYAVALRASAQELQKLESQLQQARIAFRAIREPDPPFNGSLVAIGIFPCLREAVRPFVKRLRVIQ